MILIALGSNLPAEGFATPRATLEAALLRLRDVPLRIVARSRWYRSRPVPPSGQPDFVNGAIAVETPLGAEELLAALHRVEAEFGRQRAERNAARTLDLDLLAYGEMTIEKEDGLSLPHPRLQERSFVLLPLLDIAPDWRHPRLGLTVEEMLRKLPSLDGICELDEEPKAS